MKNAYILVCFLCVSNISFYHLFAASDSLAQINDAFKNLDQKANEIVGCVAGLQAVIEEQQKQISSVGGSQKEISMLRTENDRLRNQLKAMETENARLRNKFQTMDDEKKQLVILLGAAKNAQAELQKQIPTEEDRQKLFLLKQQAEKAVLLERENIQLKQQILSLQNRPVSTNRP